MSKPKVYLGGTWNNSTWREELKPILKEVGFDWFDPVVDDWNEEARQNEIKQRQECDICLYVITPEMTGVYSIAELVDDCYRRPDKVMLIIVRRSNGISFNNNQWRSLNNVLKMVRQNYKECFFRESHYHDNKKMYKKQSLYKFFATPTITEETESIKEAFKYRLSLTLHTESS